MVTQDFFSYWFSVWNDGSIDVSGELKSSTIIVLLSGFPFLSVNVCFIYLGVPMLGVCGCVIIISSWIDPLDIMRCPYSLLWVFVLKSIFSDINITNLALFSFPFSWNTSFYPLI